MGHSIAQHYAILCDSLREQRERERSREQRLEAQFLPALLEVLETPPNPLGRTLLFILLSLLAVALVWACVGRIDVVAAAHGKVIPRGRVKSVQAPEAGVVRAIEVSDGQLVAAGELLVVLDATITQAELAQAQESLFVAQLDRARAQTLATAAEFGEIAFTLPDEVPSDVYTMQRALVAARIAEHRAGLATLRHERAQRAAEVAMIAAEVRKLELQSPLAEEQLHSMETLQRDGLVPRLRVIELKERVVSLRQDLIIRREEFAKSQAAVRGADGQLAKMRREFNASALGALNEADANYRLRAEELRKAQERTASMTVYSPIGGRVTQLSLHTVGGVVRAGDTLMTIVPRDAEMMMEAMVLNKDIGFVRPGQAAEVKFEAFPFTRYGVVAGVIETIEADAIEHDKLGLVFPCLVRLARQSIAIHADAVPLEAGFVGSVEVRTGERRIIDFLLSPLARRMQEAGRER